MKPEQQRIAIAEWCGIRRIPSSIGPVWVGPGCNNLPVPPDYLNDLNAMHEAEKRLDSENSLIPACEGYETQWDRYISTLEDVLFKVTAEEDIYKDCIFATAAQRAEALLRTIGKWEEE